MENDTVNISIPTDNPQLPTDPNQPQELKLSTGNPQSDMWTGDSCTIEECEHYKAWLTSQVKKSPPVPGAGRKCEYCKNKEKIQHLADDYVNKHAKASDKLTIPFLQELAVILDVEKETIKDWAEKRSKDAQGKPTDEFEHPELYKTYKKLMNVQELRLLQKTLGRYNPTGAIFQLKTNHGYMETEKKVVAGDASQPLVVEIVNEDRKVYESE